MNLKNLPNTQCITKNWTPTDFVAPPLVYKDWETFNSSFGQTQINPVHMNLVVDFYFENYGSRGIEHTKLNLAIFQPRFAKVISVVVENVTSNDLRDIKFYLAKSKRLHNQNFSMCPNIF